MHAQAVASRPTWISDHLLLLLAASPPSDALTIEGSRGLREKP